MRLADRFEELVDGQPDGWTTAQFDLYVYGDPEGAGAALAVIGAQRSPRPGKHWRFATAHAQTRSAWTVPMVHSVLRQLDHNEVRGELEAVPEDVTMGALARAVRNGGAR